MSDYEQLLEEISTACIKNQELHEIVQAIAAMDNLKRYELRKSASKVLKKQSGIDKEALKFYFFITEENVAEEILRRINSVKRETENSGWTSSH
ncbi:MAG TPA: hypothetical protein PK894_05755 [Defluviitoga sp.]|nr:hypothetical protein [Defluviitoga sp.]HOP25064.1 hypothetical protein [Defluviitoga sp.]HPZ29149.1 hypothetical protein [Defluviitoga sp.]HQD63079.1 hypothetical protein [Defluviitoga sp.]